MSLAHLWNRKDSHVVESKWRGRQEGDDIGKVSRCQIIEGFEGNSNEFAFYSQCDAKPLDDTGEKTKERNDWTPTEQECDGSR